MHLVAIDTETCALGAGRDRIVQFCAVELDGELRETSAWTELVHPGCRIPKAATAIHGITDEMVQGRPRFDHHAARLRSLIGSDTVFIAYNARFDLGVLNLEFARSGVSVIRAAQPVIDPLLIERRVTSRSLGPTYQRYTGRALQNAHTADADVAAMVEVLRCQLETHRDILPGLEDLVGWPRPEPRRRSQLYEDEAGVMRLGFGKHAGRAAAEVPDYLAWMLEGDFPERTKRKARRVLSERPLGLAS